jgi:hypothetical protein
VKRKKKKKKKKRDLFIKGTPPASSQELSTVPRPYNSNTGEFFEMTLYRVSARALNDVGLDVEESAHREFVADRIALNLKSHSVAIASVTDTTVEFLVPTPRGTSQKQLSVAVADKSLRVNRHDDDARNTGRKCVIFGASVLERVRFRNVAPVTFERIELEPRLLSELGAANVDVLGGAQLVVTYGSVLVSVTGATSDAHATRVLDWALQTPQVAEAVEIAIAKHAGDEPGIVSLLAHGMPTESAARALPPVVEVDKQYFVEVVFGDDLVTDASGKAMAQMIGAAVRALTGALVSCLFTSSTLPFVQSLAHASRWSYLMQTHANDFTWHSEVADSLVPRIVRNMLYAHEQGVHNAQWCLPTQGPLLVCSASSVAALEQAWPVIVQVMARSPRDDLPAVTQPRREVVWRLPQPPNESWLCVLQSGCKIDEAAMSQLVELVRGSPNLAVVDLTRAKGDGITAAAVAELLACAHVRFVSIAGAAQCESIRSALGAAHVGRLVWCPFPQCLDEIEDRSGIDWHAHRRFFSFRQAATGSIRDIRGHELFAQSHCGAVRN